MWRGTLTLLLGSGAAQLGPLLLGPFLTRLYGPEVFGIFHLASAIAANLAVVACARYEFALPLAQSEAEARAVRALCIRVLIAVGLATLLGAVMAAWWWGITWPLSVPPTVCALGLLSLCTLEATRRSRISALAGARITQFWGSGALQLALGTLHAGLWSLLLGPILAASAAAWVLWRSARAPASRAVRSQAPAPQCSMTPPQAPSTQSGSSDWKAAARRHRDFPLLNTPHAFLGALQDTLSIALIAAWVGPAAAGIWALALRYLKAPATLVGGAVSQVLYPALGAQVGATAQARAQVRQIMQVLLLCGALLGATVYTTSRWALPALLGPGWEAAGSVGQALAVYVALHFVASPLGVVTMAWRAQAWALRMAVVGQVVFISALAVGLMWPAAEGERLVQAAWGVSVAMALFFCLYFSRLWYWPVNEADARDN